VKDLGLSTKLEQEDHASGKCKWLELFLNEVKDWIAEVPYYFSSEMLKECYILFYISHTPHSRHPERSEGSG
jgi:hypothetical protein